LKGQPCKNSALSNDTYCSRHNPNKGTSYSSAKKNKNKINHSHINDDDINEMVTTAIEIPQSDLKQDIKECPQSENPQYSNEHIDAFIGFITKPPQNENEAEVLIKDIMKLKDIPHIAAEQTVPIMSPNIITLEEEPKPQTDLTADDMADMVEEPKPQTDLTADDMADMVEEPKPQTIISEEDGKYDKIDQFIKSHKDELIKIGVTRDNMIDEINEYIPQINISDAEQRLYPKVDNKQSAVYMVIGHHRRTICEKLDILKLENEDWDYVKLNNNYFDIDDFNIIKAFINSSRSELVKVFKASLLENGNNRMYDHNTKLISANLVNYIRLQSKTLFEFINESVRFAEDVLKKTRHQAVEYEIDRLSKKISKEYTAIPTVSNVLDNNNNYAKLDLLKYGKTVFTDSFSEHINADILHLIVSNRAIFEPLLRADRRKEASDRYDAFQMAEMFLKKSRNGIVEVRYKQNNGVGRFNAIRSMSLQNITRQIRQAICSDYYIDIDMENAHPTILKWICDQNGIACPILTKYVNNRPQFFEDMKVKKSVGKQVMLSTLNGGYNDYNALTYHSDDLREFHNREIRNIWAHITKLHPTEFKDFVEKKTKSGEDFNLHGSFINILMCEIENKILQIMCEYFGNPRDAVLCFDGIMLNKNKSYDLRGCEAAIFDKLKIKIKLAIKPFEDAFNIDSFNTVPKYKQMSLEYYPDFRNLIKGGEDVPLSFVDEWARNCISIIDNGGKEFIMTKSKSIDYLTKEERVYHKQVRSIDVLRNLNVNCNILNPTYDYGLVKQLSEMDSAAKKKLMKGFNDDKKATLEKYIYKSLGMNRGINSKGYLETMLSNGSLNYYNNVDFMPFLERKEKPELYQSFNVFTGFPMERVEQKKHINFEDSKLYKHIRDELMGGEDIGEFNHFLDHIADIIQDPANIKTNGHLFYTKQGMGKGLLAKFISILIGGDHAVSFENTEAYFGKFNVDQSNKLLKIFEEVSNKGVAFSNHDRLKGDQAKTSERIEPKGIDPYKIHHCARFWYFTNNENALYIEGDDRRFTCHKANNRYANNIDYFKPIWEEVEDKQFCKAAFEFFATRSYDRMSQFRCYNTKFKEEQKQLNLPNALKFLKEFIEDGCENVVLDECKVKSKELAGAYKNWCESSGTKFNLGTFKTQMKKINMIEKNARYFGSVSKCYLLNKEEMRGKFADYLNINTFKFNMANEIDNE
jgi:hypothetical protein